MNGYSDGIYRRLTALLAVVSLALATGTGAGQRLALHEWGTFTSLQDEAGEAIGGINTDDEPVPPFVHRLASFLLLPPTEIPATFFQGAPSCHPDVTMRLETPVIYFHPTESESNLQSANVHVTFRGGWLTEFYPDAIPDAPGLKDGPSRFPPVFSHLFSTTESSLEWNNLNIGGDWVVTNTSAHVWTSPRAVQSARVQTTHGEAEKFLFYRGVAHLNAPLRVSRDPNTGELLFRRQLDTLPASKPLGIHSIWLVDIRREGEIAFRSLPPLSIEHDSTTVLTRTPAVFASTDYEAGHLEKLKAALRGALVSEGLYTDEAQALLNTWELSYFKSPGLRVFFIVPRAWIDFYLPLHISIPADIHRVMVGRIELVAPVQRRILETMAQFSLAEIIDEAGRLRTNFYASPAVGGNEWQELASGRKPLSTSVSVPKTYQTYLGLGRFRNALLLEQSRTHPSAGLAAFITAYRLEAYKPL